MRSMIDNNTEIVSLPRKRKKLYGVIYSKYKKFQKQKMSYLLEKKLVFSIICSKCNNRDTKLLKEKESIETLKILGLIENLWLL